jgi:hypothetical protein
MITINRTAIVLRPGQRFRDWLHGADPTSNELRLEDLRREPTVYQLPECEKEGEVREYLAEVYGQIFEEQLDGRYRVPSSWRAGGTGRPSMAGSSGVSTQRWSISATNRCSKKGCHPGGFIFCPGPSSPEKLQQPHRHRPAESR